MPGIEKLKQVEGLAAPNLSEQKAVGPVTERRFEQVTDGHGRDPVLLAARFEAYLVLVGELNLRRVFDEHQALFGRDEAPEATGEGRFSGPGSTADEYVLARQDIVLEPVGQAAVEGSGSNQILHFQMSRAELAYRSE